MPQRLVGYGVSQVPTNGMLGGMAYQDPINVSIGNITVGGGSLTGTTSQTLQVTGGAYISGNLGIGATNPGAKLHVVGGTIADGGEYNLIVASSDANNIPTTITSGISGSTLQIFSGGMDSVSRRGGQIDFIAGAATTNPGILIFRTGTVTGGTSQPEVARFNTSGNLGIGTTNPTSKLTVRGDVSIASTVGIGTIIDIVPYDTLNSGTLSFEGSVGQLFSITNNLTSGSIYSVNDVSGIPSIDVDADGTIQLGPYGGKVGIGITNPGAPLTIQSDSTSHAIRILGRSGDNTSALVFYDSSQTNYYSYLQSAPSYLAFGIVNEVARFDSVGNFLVGAATSTISGSVGIGTTNPTSKLTVRGDVSIASTVGIGTIIDIVPYDTLNSGTLSFEGSVGQLFSITNNLTSGSIYSVNDVSGIPSIDVDADGTIQLGPYGGKVGIGTTNPQTKLDVIGGAYVSGSVGIGTTNPNLIGANVNAKVLTIQSNGANVFARSVLELSNPYSPAQGSTLGEIWFTTGRSSTGFTTEMAVIRGFAVGSATSFGYGTVITFVTKDNNAAFNFRESARFDSSGNFLIGAATSTGTVSQPLQVTGGAYVSGNLGVGGTNPGISSIKLLVVGNDVTPYSNTGSFPSGHRVSIVNNNSVGTDLCVSVLSFSSINAEGFNSTSWIANLATPGSEGDFGRGGTMVFGRRVGNNSAETLRLTRTGNVGIGTTNPSTKLSVDGVISVSAGTTSAPAIIPSGDSNTGVFFPSLDTFAVATNGTERIKVSAGGTFAFGGPSVGFSTNKNYHFYTPGNAVLENASFYFESTQDLSNVGGRQYGIYVNQRGARYTNQTAIYAQPLEVFASNYRGVHGVTLFPNQAGGTTEAIFGETTIPDWNYQARHCAVRGIAQGGSTTFSNTYGLGPSNGAFGGHFVAYGKADVCGVYADAYQTASPGAGTIAVPLIVASNSVEKLRVTADGNLNLGQPSSALQSGGTGLTVYGSTSSEIKFLNSTTGITSTDGTALVATGIDFTINNREAGNIIFGTNNAERARIDSSGRLLVGTSSASGFQAGTKHIFMDGGGASFSSVSIGNPGGASNQTDLNITAWTGGGSNYFTSKIRQGGDGSLSFSTQTSVSADGSASPTEAMRINNQREVLIGTTTRNANGGVLQLNSGITFPATAVAVTDANTLDDYEEGTWTPTVTAGSGSFTTVTTSGRYVKIGKTVLIGGQVNITTTGTAAGAITVTNPPFNAAANDTFCGTAAQRQITNASGGFVKFQSSASFSIVEFDGTTLIADGNQLIFSIFYEVS